MADEPLKETAPAPAENRRTTAAPTPSSTASASAAKPAKSPPAVRKKAAAKPRAKSAAKPAIKPAAPTRTTTAPSGFGVTVAGLLESSARPYVSAHEQIASATQGTWIAPVAELNARLITQVAAAQADLARRLLG